MQGGKSFLGALWLARRIEDYPDDEHAIIAPTYKILQQSTLPKFFELSPHYRKYYNKVDSVLAIPRENGKIQNVYIRSTDNPLSLEGMTLKSAWLDEAGQMKPEAFLFIQARVAIKSGHVFITTTPYNMGWLYLDFYKPVKERKDGYEDFEVFTWASVDNPYFPVEEFERVKKTLDPKTFARRYLGEFTKMEGLVYDVSEDLLIEPCDIDTAYTLAGVDFGFNNPSSIVVIRQDRDNRFFIVDEWYERGKTIPELIEKCKQLRNKWGINKFYADAASPEKIEEMSRNDLYVEPGLKDIQAGISLIQQLLRERRVFIFKTCYNIINEFETYHYPAQDEVDDKHKDVPVKENDHSMDAIRYALHSYMPTSSFNNEVYVPKVLKW